MDDWNDSLVINGMHARFDLAKRRWRVIAPNGRTVRRFNHLGIAAAWMTKHPEFLSKRQRLAQNSSQRSKQWRERTRMEKESGEH